MNELEEINVLIEEMKVLEESSRKTIEDLQKLREIITDLPETTTIERKSYPNSIENIIECQTWSE